MADELSQSVHCILLFGGTFDPPHLAHARLPAQAAIQLGCDEILYIPAAINPLKADAGSRPPTAKEHRVAMLLLAIANVPNAKICTLELERGENKPSYTIDTLRQLHAQDAASQPHQFVPRTQFRLLIGCDQALEFHRWKDWQEILQLATPAVLLRPPWDLASFEKELRAKFSNVEAEQWLKWTLRLPMMDVSATNIRELIKQGEYPTLASLLDPAVIEYIRVNRLYH